MTRMKNRSLFPTLAAIGLGLIARKLDSLLLRDGTSGILRTPSAIALGGLTVLALLLLFLMSRNPGEKGLLPRFLEPFADLPLFLCIVLVAYKMFPLYSGVFQKVLLILDGVAILSSLLCCQLPGKTPVVRSLCRSFLCLFFAGHVLACIRLSVSNPQVHRYLPELLAFASLMAFSYYDAIRSLKDTSRESYAFWRLAGIYFCLMATVTCGEVFWSAFLWLAILNPVKVIPKEDAA